MNHTENYYSGDRILEGVVVEKLFGMPSATAGAQALSGADHVEHERLRPTAEELDAAFIEAVAECRRLGLTDEEIRDSIGLNLRTYGYASETFPIDRWMT